MEKAEPIQLAAMTKGGMSADGDVVAFTFQAQDGHSFAFSCPHEAIPEIIDKLSALAVAAWERRGSPNYAEITKGERGTARFTDITGTKLAAAAQGVVLSLVSGPMVRDIMLSPDRCMELSEQLRQAVAERKKFFPDH